MIIDYLQMVTPTPVPPIDQPALGVDADLLMMEGSMNFISWWNQLAEHGVTDLFQGALILAIVFAGLGLVLISLRGTNDV